MDNYAYKWTLKREAAPRGYLEIYSIQVEAETWQEAIEKAQDDLTFAGPFATTVTVTLDNEV